MNLKDTYDSNNNLRMYREDETGKEYVYYRDKKQRVIIRDFFEEDAVPWCNAMLERFNFNATQKNACIKTFLDIVRSRKEDDPEYSLVVTSLSGKILGELVFTNVLNDEGCGAVVQISVRDKNTAQTMGEAIVTALSNLQQKYYFYDVLYVEDTNGQKKKLCIT